MDIGDYMTATGGLAHQLFDPQIVKGMIFKVIRCVSDYEASGSWYQMENVGTGKKIWCMGFGAKADWAYSTPAEISSAKLKIEFDNE